MRLVDEGSTSSLLLSSADSNDGDREADRFRLFLLDEAEKVQAVVKAKVKLSTWDAFWLVAVCDWTVERTAKNLGKIHTAVYAARERVARMLCDQGKCVSDLWGAGA
jgi:hypothetical protein